MTVQYQVLVPHQYHGGSTPHHVRRSDTPRGSRIVVLLGGVDHVLTVEQATRLRDELTEALGADGQARCEPRTRPIRWLGPRESDLMPDGTTLRHPVPPERWPWCLPEEHDRGCGLHRGGLFCDCGASCADDDGVVR